MLGWPARSVRFKEVAMKKLIFTASLSLAAGCGGLPEVDCATVTVPKYSEVTILNSCNACHSSALSGEARQDAPDSVNFDTYEAAVKDAEDAVSEVYGGSMPPEGYQVTEEQRQALYAWGLCGTPK